VIDHSIFLKEMEMSKVWLLTGASRGLGRAIAETVLAAGDRLVAGARDPKTLNDLVIRYPETLRTVALDVQDPVAAEAAVQTVLNTWGRLDVLVNNAGFGHVVPFEQMSAEDFRGQIETNLFGVVNLTRAAVPVMRRQRSGHIFQVSSLGGRIGNPGLSAYQAAKWAVGGFTEVLAQELAPFGVHVTALEPGAMRTDWGGTAQKATPELGDYQASMGPFLELLGGIIGQETGDPSKVAKVILALAQHPAPPAHLLLGSDALHYSSLADAARAAAGERWKSVGAAVDFGTPGELPTFPEAG
jgi:NAD(P)-dependent dehydrogenase (short-subunit alcohol dehydrogenase family)